MLSKNNFVAVSLCTLNLRPKEVKVHLSYLRSYKVC